MLPVPDPFSGSEFDTSWTFLSNAHPAMSDINTESMLAFSIQPEQPVSQASQQLLYDLLAKTIFNFRPSYMVEWSLDEIDDRRRTEGFVHVSTLCDALQQSLSHNLDTQAATTLAMLVTTSVDMIKDAYRPLLERCLAVLRHTRRLSRPAMERISAICSTISCHAHRMVMLLQQMQHVEGMQQVMHAWGLASVTALQCLQQDATDTLELLGAHAPV